MLHSFHFDKGASKRVEIEVIYQSSGNKIEFIKLLLFRIIDLYLQYFELIHSTISFIFLI